MKKTLLLVLLTIFFFSCSKHDLARIDTANDGSTFVIRDKLNEQMNDADIEELFPANFDPSTLTEAQAEDIVEPLIANGQNLYNELLLNVQGTSEWNNLTQEEQYNISHLTDQQLVMLSLIYDSAAQGDINWSKTRSCLSGALGLGTLYGLIQNTSALMTVQGTLSVLKLVGKRYLGYIGLALAIWDFIDCIKTTPGDETPILNEAFHAMDLDSYLIPTPFPSPIVYTNIASTLTDGLSHPLTTTPIFFNPNDNKYYSNSNFTAFVPNGFYNSPVLMTGNPQVYHIVDGVSIMSYAIQ